MGSTFSGPVSPDAAATYWNPGMLGYIERGDVYLGVGLAAGRIGYERNRLGVYQTEDSLQFQDPIDPMYVDPTKSGPAAPVSSPIIAPTADIFIGVPIVRDRLAMGFGFYVPYAAPLRFPEEGAQKFQLRQAFLVVNQITASIAVKPHRVISIGAGISYVLGFGGLTRVQDFAAVDAFGQALANPPISQENDLGADAPTTVRELDVLARPFAFTDGISHGISFNVGVALRPVEALSLGLVYDHGSQLRFRGDFTLDMNDDFFTSDLAPQGLEFPPLVEGDAELSFRLAKRIVFGLGYDLPTELPFRLETTLAYVFWQDLDAFVITLDSPDLAQPALGLPAKSTVALPRDWNGSVHAELHARLRPHDIVRLSMTFGYHSPASPDATIDVASPDGHRLLGGVGVGVDVKGKVEIIVDGEVQGIVQREVTSSDYDLGNGTYDLVISQVGLHFRVPFGKGGKVPASRAKPPDGAGGA